jgi:hypothetical protein
VKAPSGLYTVPREGGLGSVRDTLDSISSVCCTEVRIVRLAAAPLVYILLLTFTT